jgi:hypothetical protein
VHGIARRDMRDVAGSPGLFTEHPHWPFAGFPAGPETRAFWARGELSGLAQ